MLLPADATVKDAASLHTLLCGAADGNVATIDCRQLERCDAAGLQLLIALRDALALHGHRLELLHVPAEQQWRFAFVGLDGAFAATDAEPVSVDHG